MNIDSDFQIGATHAICQDYALHRQISETEAFVVVCDGCSASQNVDVGARLLALIAENCLFDFDVFKRDENYNNFSANIVDEITVTIRNVFPHLHPNTFDATLLFTHIKENKTVSYIYGDGVFLHHGKNGRYSLKVDFPNNAPDYISYNLNAIRKNNYIQVAGTKIVEIEDEIGKQTICQECSPFDPVMIYRDVEPGDVIGISSDGIGSFRNLDNKPINWKIMADDFLSIGKPTKGVFVKRNLNALKRKCQKDGTTHSDDISFAAIHV